MLLSVLLLHVMVLVDLPPAAFLVHVVYTTTVPLYLAKQ